VVPIILHSGRVRAQCVQRGPAV